MLPALLGSGAAVLLTSLATLVLLPAVGANALFLPSCGVALGLMLVFGLRIWPVVAAALVLAGVLAGEPLAHTLAHAAGSMAALWLAGWLLLQRSPFDRNEPRFSVLPHLLLWGCALAAGLGALATAALTALIDRGHEACCGPALAQAWMGHALGFLLVTPLVLALHCTAPRRVRARGWARRWPSGC